MLNFLLGVYVGGALCFYLFITYGEFWPRFVMAVIWPVAPLFFERVKDD